MKAHRLMGNKILPSTIQVLRCFFTVLYEHPVAYLGKAPSGELTSGKTLGRDLQTLKELEHRSVAISQGIDDRKVVPHLAQPVLDKMVMPCLISTLAYQCQLDIC